MAAGLEELAGDYPDAWNLHNVSTVPYNLDVTSVNDTMVANSSASPTLDRWPGWRELEIFNEFYKPIHGYLASIVCAFGIIANILNIVVLTRKNMISPTNCILTGLAVSDGLTMLAYLPFALWFYCLYGTETTPERNTLAAVRYMLFFACFSVVVHTVSIWLTVTLTVFRYIVVKYPRHGPMLCNLERAKLAVLLNYLVTIVVCIPNYITLQVRPENEKNTTYIVSYKLDTSVDRFLQSFNFWVQAILVKLLPCVGLTILSILLIKFMKHTEQMRKKMLQNKGGGGQALKGGKSNAREKKTNRTTRMLLVVVFLFLLTEFPQGILTLLSGIWPSFANDIYGPLGDLLDILALVNNGVNFILYCSMSKQFRETFIDIFFYRCSKRSERFKSVQSEVNVSR